MCNALKMPNAEKDGFFIPTLNHQGFMGKYPSDPYMKKFIEFSSDTNGSVLDIGAAYGVASLEALKNGAHVFANDIDENHLKILKDRVPDQFKKNLTLLPGRFPSELNLAKDSINGVLVSRVLHFFSGDEIEEAFQAIHHWLRSEGRLYVTAETPYLKNIQSFIPVYEKRVEEGRRWPGYIDDFSQIDQRKGYNLPKTIHLLDPEVLTRCAKEVGFKVIECETFARPEFPETLQLDGRESVGLVAVKV